MATEKPLVVIVGPTASGKTDLAIKIAKRFDGEIISADSRAIYRHMDIGTAKPTLDEQKQIKHWGIDLVEPDARFTVADFQKYTNHAIADIRSRDKLPILAGGSGLYIDSIIFDYNFTTDYDPDRRLLLETKSIDELVKYCKKHNINLPENKRNKRYITRSIERNGQNHNNRDQVIKNCIIFGIDISKEELINRIILRTDKIFDNDIIAETKYLTDKYPFSIEAMKSNIYPIIWRMIKGEITEQQAKELFIIDDWHLAKKQITWFKRNPFIKWMSISKIEQYIHETLV